MKTEVFEYMGDVITEPKCKECGWWLSVCSCDEDDKEDHEAELVKYYASSKELCDNCELSHWDCACDTVEVVE